MNKLWLRLKRVIRGNFLGARLVASYYRWRFAFKCRLLISTASKYGLSILVETGTFRGYTVEVVERAFGVIPDYPSIQEIRELAASHWPSYDFKVKRDVMRITPSADSRKKMTSCSENIQKRKELRLAM